MYLVLALILAYRNVSMITLVSVSSPTSTRMFWEFSISKVGRDDVSAKGFEYSPVDDFEIGFLRSLK